MALKITRANEAIKVNSLCVTLYSQPGLGKTSLAYTARNPLLLDFDKGAYRAVDRKDVVQVEQWSDVAGIRAQDVEGYDTIIIDTVGKALDALSSDIIRSNSKLGYGGALNQQGWGQLGTRFSAFLKLLKGFGKDVILIAHMDEQKDGDQIKERLKISGGSKDLVLTDSDMIGRISIVNRERHLIFSPTEASFGKDPARIGEMEIPDASDESFADCMASIIESVKDKLNSMSEEQTAHKAEVDWFRATLPDIVDADGINSLMSRSKKAGRDVQKLLVDRAKELGFDFDPGKKEFVDPNAVDESKEDDDQPSEDLGGDKIPY